MNVVKHNNGIDWECVYFEIAHTDRFSFNDLSGQILVWGNKRMCTSCSFFQFEFIPQCSTLLNSSFFCGWLCDDCLNNLIKIIDDKEVISVSIGMPKISRDIFPEIDFVNITINNQDLCVSKSYVSLDQFSGFVKSTNYISTAELKGDMYNYWKNNSLSTYSNPDDSVSCVSYIDAINFCISIGGEILTESEIKLIAINFRNRFNWGALEWVRSDVPNRWLRFSSSGRNVNSHQYDYDLMSTFRIKRKVSSAGVTT